MTETLTDDRVETDDGFDALADRAGDTTTPPASGGDDDGGGGGGGPPATAKDDDLADKRLEIVATVLLGAATVLIALAAYQSALWGGIQDTALTDSVRLNTEANDEFQLGDGEYNLDQELFVEFVVQFEAQVATSDATGDAEIEELFAAYVEPDGLGGFVLASMTPEGHAGALAWFENDDATPFEAEAYLDARYGAAEALYAESQVVFEDAGEANGNSDDFVLASTLLAAVLFFAGISTVLSSTPLRTVLLAGGSAILIGSGALMANLPWTEML